MKQNNISRKEYVRLVAAETGATISSVDGILDAAEKVLIGKLEEGTFVAVGKNFKIGAERKVPRRIWSNLKKEYYQIPERIVPVARFGKYFKEGVEDVNKDNF